MTAHEKDVSSVMLSMRMAVDEGSPRSPFMNDYRPFLPGAGYPLACDNSWQNCGENEYLADRGILWSFNPEKGNAFVHDVSGDNEVHLTATAFVTGPYAVRVRGQAALAGFSDALWSTHDDFGVGVPYTLNLNVGVIPNPVRPHWQFLDHNADPTAQLTCGR